MLLVSSVGCSISPPCVLLSVGRADLASACGEPGYQRREESSCPVTSPVPGGAPREPDLEPPTRVRLPGRSAAGERILAAVGLDGSSQGDLSPLFLKSLEMEEEGEVA